MPEYLVTWEVEVTADSPYDAALEAQCIQFEQTNDITEEGCFSVTDLDPESNECIIVDLAQEHKSNA